MIKNHLGLFEGIGGFSLAARWMGWETIAWCEWNEFGQKVLKHHFPKATGHGDITKTDFTIYRGQCDILTGGFPCQPYSQAGKRLGKEDERHLWPSMLRAIREIQPAYVVGENVSGLINWNGGMVFNEVQTDLEAEGYEVLPFVLPACGVNAPHRRDRVWFIAYSHNARANYRSGINGNGKEENKGWQGQPQPEFGQDSSNGLKNPNSIRWTGNERQEEPNERQQREFSTGNNERIQTNDGEIGITANTNNNGLQQYIYRGEQSQLLGKQKKERTNRNTIIIKPIEAVGSRRITSNTECSRGGEVHSNMETGEPNGYGINAINEQNTWHNFPTQPPLCGGNDGLSRELDGITFPKWRTESIKAYGNAIVPQVAFQIFKAIEEINNKI